MPSLLFAVTKVPATAVLPSVPYFVVVSLVLDFRQFFGDNLDVVFVIGTPAAHCCSLSFNSCCSINRAIRVSYFVLNFSLLFNKCRRSSVLR